MQKGTCLTIAERKTQRSATKQGFEKRLCGKDEERRKAKMEFFGLIIELG